MDTPDDESLPPWAQLPEPSAAGASEAPADERRQVEQATRWRLILGRFADEQLGEERTAPLVAGESEGPGGAGGAAGLLSRIEEAGALDGALEVIYDREYAQRAHRQVGGGAGQRSEGLSVPAWLGQVRELFPREAAHVIERDALRRYGMHELVTDADILRRAEPTEDLLKAILTFKHLMDDEVLVAARDMVRRIVAQIAERLQDQVRPALTGAHEPGDRPPPRTFANTDWHRTIRRNLKHYDAERGRLVAERIHFKHRQKRRSGWRIVVAVDQSGSMLDSLIHSAVMAAIFATLPSVKAHLVLWDNRIMDVTDAVDDPMEVLMRAQLGGGTALLPALQYCAQLVTEPERTILVVISDFYLFGEQERCLALAHELHEAGVRGVGLCALDTEARPVYDEAFARELAGCGWTVAAMTPRKLAEHIGKILA